MKKNIFAFALLVGFGLVIVDNAIACDPLVDPGCDIVNVLGGGFVNGSQIQDRLDNMDMSPTTSYTDGYGEQCLMGGGFVDGGKVEIEGSKFQYDLSEKTNTEGNVRHLSSAIMEMFGHVESGEDCDEIGMDMISGRDHETLNEVNGNFLGAYADNSGGFNFSFLGTNIRYSFDLEEYTAYQAVSNDGDSGQTGHTFLGIHSDNIPEPVSQN